MGLGYYWKYYRNIGGKTRRNIGGNLIGKTNGVSLAIEIKIDHR